MKKEKQIGVRVGLPTFFALELEDVYKHTEGAHRALAFPDFCGYLIGIGLEVYRQGKSGARITREDIDGQTPKGSWDWQEESPEVLKQFRREVVL